MATLLVPVLAAALLAATLGSVFTATLTDRRWPGVVAATLLGAIPVGVAVVLFMRRRVGALAADYEASLALSREQALSLSEEDKFRRLVEAVSDYAIFLLDAEGNVVSWNAGAERGTGWRTDEILGRHVSTFFTAEDRAADRSRTDLAAAARDGSCRVETELIRKDGSRFLAEVTLSAVRDASNRVIGYAEIARDITSRRRGEAAIANLNGQLELRVAELAAANQELEAFSYSVSHDLRGPLRAIDGFSTILLEQYHGSLDEQGRHYLDRVRAGSQRMGHLIDDLLGLARINRAEMHRATVDLAQVAREVTDELHRGEPERAVELHIAGSAPARGDGRLLRVALENLLGNAWKFTRRQSAPRIEFGSEPRDGVPAFFVRDNGAGFDMTYAHKLFLPFQRLHDVTEFEGSGIGLATVQRIVNRHGGRIWGESQPGQGTTFWFTLGEG
ncbi:MAG: hybrid sensor histidine kinase/response regulator [Myxococcales bacterium]|nr:hybrid sensor histidine kinase/response regulator [Myxococcales bacterium]